MKTDIFHLQIVPLSDILTHEEYDQSRALPLVEQLKKDGFLANPVIVASFDDKKFLQLDGMNRYSAFKMLGFSSILVQIIDYNDQEAVELASWLHLFHGDYHQILQEMENMHVEVQKGSFDYVGSRYVKEEGKARICTVLNKKGEVYFLYSGGTIIEKIQTLRKMVDWYKDGIVRDVLPQHPNAHDFVILFEEHPETNTMVVFPTFTRHQIVDVVRKGELFPAGITRHLIQRRCLNVNVPLSLFSKNASIKEQNESLEKLLSQRPFRLYEEPTIYFE
ncbi:ParB N-terminal domain-containing protein [Candidatus Gottesmanbacteria bacterium]|nr:ParB N-terminal domain-containing protein [Candidatus Gottesmanbacteria bacterium]